MLPGKPIAIVAWDMSDRYEIKPIALVDDEAADNYVSTAILQPDGLYVDNRYGEFANQALWLRALPRKPS